MRPSRLLLPWLLWLGTAAAAPERAHLLIAPCTGTGLAPQERGAVDALIRLHAVQSEAFLVLSPDEVANRLAARNQILPADCFSSTCLRHAASAFENLDLALGVRAGRRDQIWSLDLLLLDLRGDGAPVQLALTSNPKDQDLSAFVRTAITQLMTGRAAMASGREKRSLASFEADNRWKYLAAGSVTAVSALWSAWRGGQLAGEDGNSRTIGGVRPVPEEGLSSLRGFYAVPHIAARYRGQGEAGLAMTDDGNASQLNPAGLAHLRNERVAYNQTRLPGGAPAFSLQYAGPVKGNLFQSLGFRSDGDGLASEIAFHGALAMDLAPFIPNTSSLLAGISLKGYLLSVGDQGSGVDRSTGHGSGFGLDVGFQFPLTAKVSAGLLVRDAWSRIDYQNTLTNAAYREDLPPQFLVGAACRVSPDLVLAIDGEKALLQDQSDLIMLGATKTFFQLVDVRLGTSQIMDRENSRNLSLGIGFQGQVERRSLSVNYAYEFGTERTTALGASHVFSVELGL